MSSNPSALVSRKGPNIGQTFSALGTWAKDPSLSNANAVLQTGDPSLQRTGDFLMGFSSQTPDPLSAGTPPTLGSATTEALQAQLLQEMKMRSSATLFAGNQAPPASAGAQLTGR